MEYLGLSIFNYLLFHALGASSAPWLTRALVRLPGWLEGFVRVGGCIRERGTGEVVGLLGGSPLSTDLSPASDCLAASCADTGGLATLLGTVDLIAAY